jgi:hypothetical protein
MRYKNGEETDGSTADAADDLRGAIASDGPAATLRADIADSSLLTAISISFRSNPKRSFEIKLRFEI